MGCLWFVLFSFALPSFLFHSLLLLSQTVPARLPEAIRDWTGRRRKVTRWLCRCACPKKRRIEGASTPSTTTINTLHKIMTNQTSSLFPPYEDEVLQAIMQYHHVYVNCMHATFSLQKGMRYHPPISFLSWICLHHNHWAVGSWIGSHCFLSTDVYVWHSYMVLPVSSLHSLQLLAAIQFPCFRFARIHGHSLNQQAYEEP